MVQIEAKTAHLNLLLEHHIRRRDNPGGNLERLLATERMRLTLLQDTQQLRLCGQRKIRNLVEKNASVFCKLESTLLALICACKRSFFMPKEF